MDIPIPLQEALRDSITSGTFIDTKFWVFSKRNPKIGRVGEPKALFVNGHVVRNVPRLGALLDRKETKENLRTKFPVDRKPYTGDYDYDDDSDLEEDEDCDFSDFEDSKVVPKKGKSEKSESSIEDTQNLDGKENPSSDVISISDMDSLFSDSSEAKAEAGMVATPAPTPTHIGTVVVIEDVAFVTFQALLRYLYTNEIEFAPWGSKEERNARALEEISEPYETPKPSPKSMYRLADKYDIPELKELALQHIQRDLSKCDIVEEVFSEYTSRYLELRKLELKQLARALLSTDSSAARHAFKDKIKAYNCGQLPHAKDILPALYELMESDEAFKEMPAEPPVPLIRCATDEDWESLKDALTWSLTSGTFLDCQFYTLDSRSGSGVPRVRPVYFCSIAGDKFLPKVSKYSSRIGPSTKALLQYSDDYDSDIDYEAMEMGIPVDAYPRAACIPEDPLPACESPAPALVLKSGTVKTWSAIFFYVYTSHIAFSTIGSPEVTIKSQEKETSESPSSSETNPLQESRATSPPLSGAATIEPCSPKSVYALANKIGLTRLCDLAFDNIKSQLCEKNIVKELFSPFAANHEHIIEMEHSLFHSKFKSSVGCSSLLDIIRESPSGENPHRVVAMELIFDRIIDDCQERMLAQAKKSSQANPVAQPSSREILTSTSTTATQPTTGQPSFWHKWSNSEEQSAQKQPMRTEPDSPELPPPVEPSDPQAQPRPMLLAQPPTSQASSSRPSLIPPTPQVINSAFSRSQLAPPTPQTTRALPRRGPWPPGPSPTKPPPAPVPPMFF